MEYQDTLLTIAELAVAFAGFASIVSVVSLANVFGLAGGHAFSLYVAHVLMGLCVSGLSFLAVVGSALGFGGPARDGP